MFQFRRFPTYAYLIQRRLTEYCSAGFPHSVILGSMDMCSSPRLIAACHDLLRLLMPRHSPCALSSLTSRRKRSLRHVSGSQELCRHNLTEEFLAFVAFTLLKFPQRAVTLALDTSRLGFPPTRAKAPPEIGPPSGLSPSLQSIQGYVSTQALPSSVACSHISGMFSSLFSFQGATL